MFSTLDPGPLNPVYLEEVDEVEREPAGEEHQQHGHQDPAPTTVTGPLDLSSKQI